VEYYSALKRYRLIELLGKVIANSYAGFKLDNINPLDPFELADPEVRAYVEEQRANRNQGKTRNNNDFVKELTKHLSPQDARLLSDKFSQEKQRPPRVAILGKAGVGKTTTINSVFNAQWKTSHTIVGTTEAQMKEFELKDGGGTLSVVDLPGYGRSVREDAEYEKIYQEIIPSCDVVLLIMQADSRDLADDQEIILKLTHWLEESPTPQR
jgi:GTP-binding protein EngB required for normal cell division